MSSSVITHELANFDMIYQSIPGTYNKYDRRTIRENLNLTMPAKIGINNWADEVRWKSFKKSAPLPRRAMMEEVEKRREKLEPTGMDAVMKKLVELKFPLKKFNEKGIVEQQHQGVIEQLSFNEILEDLNIERRVARLRNLLELLRGPGLPAIHLAPNIIQGMDNQDLIVQLVRRALGEMGIRAEEVMPKEEDIMPKKDILVSDKLLQAIKHIDMTEFEVGIYDDIREARVLLKDPLEELYQIVINHFLTEQGYTMEQIIALEEPIMENFDNFTMWMQNKYTDEQTRTFTTEQVANHLLQWAPERLIGLLEEAREPRREPSPPIREERKEPSPMPKLEEAMEEALLIDASQIEHMFPDEVKSTRDIALGLPGNPDVIDRNYYTNMKHGSKRKLIDWILKKCTNEATNPGGVLTWANFDTKKVIKLQELLRNGQAQVVIYTATDIKLEGTE